MNVFRLLNIILNKFLFVKKLTEDYGINHPVKVQQDMVQRDNEKERKNYRVKR